MHGEPFVVGLAELREDRAPQAGNKATRLAQAAAAGFAVPEGFVVTTAAFRALLGAMHPSGRPLGEVIAERLAAGEGREPARLGEVARAVAALVEATALPEDVAAAATAAYLALPGAANGEPPRVAVRSSAPNEDGAVRSYAGHFDSFLDVAGPEALLDRLRRCFASAWSEPALAARLRHPGGGPAAAPSEMAVLVQVMVRGGPGGVLFTRDPLGGPDHMVAELSASGAERVARGDEIPVRLAIDRKSGKLVPVNGGAKRAGSAAPLTGELLRLGLGVETLFGRPQDIEWASGEDGRVYLLQARPVTSAAARGDLWTAANSQEAIEDPVTPLTYTLLAPWIDRGRKRVFSILSVEEPPGEYMKLFEGRIYFNVNYFRRFLERIPGISPDIFDLLLFGDAGEITFPVPPLRLQTLEVAATVLRTWPAALGRMDRFVGRLNARLRAIAPIDLGLLSDRDLLRHLGRISKVLDQALNLHVLGSAMAGGHYLLLKRFLRSTAVALDENVTDELLAGAPGIETARSNAALFDLAGRAAALPAVRNLILDERDAAAALARLKSGMPGGAEFQAALDGFLDEFGHRAEKEAEFARPRWREDPTFIFRAVRRFLELGAGTPEGASRGVRSPSEVERDLVARRRRVARRVERALGARGRRLGLERLAFRWLLRWAERSAPYRENMRFHALRLFERVRGVLLEIGRRLAARRALARADDVFFLEAGEAFEALARGPALPPEAAARLAARAAERGAAYGRLLASPPPPKLLHDDGTEAAPPAIAANGPRASSDEAGHRFLEGVSVSSGVATGRARLIERLEDGWTLKPDEILLARAATPSWTPLFFFARGVILDLGGMLSHCAVIAREYGIPCVVGLKTATSLIRDGDLVTVDAHRGRVYLP